MQPGVMLTSGNCRNDTDFVAFVDFCGPILKEPDVFIVDENIHEAADISICVADSLAQTRKGGVEVGENFIDGCALDLDDIEVAGELA